MKLQQLCYNRNRPLVRQHFGGNTMIYKLTHNHKNNLPKQNTKSLNSIFFLLYAVLLVIPSFGCGTTMFASDSKYVAPNLPVSELATIQIDTDGQWIQRINQVSLRINGKLASQMKFTENTKDTENKVLLVPGKHTISLIVLTDTFPDGERKNLQISSNLSANVKPGITYILKGEFDNSIDDDLTAKLIDINTEKVVSKSRVTTKSTFDQEELKKSSGFSVKYVF